MGKEGRKRRVGGRRRSNHPESPPPQPPGPSQPHSLTRDPWPLPRLSVALLPLSCCPSCFPVFGSANLWAPGAELGFRGAAVTEGATVPAPMVLSV